ncbi:MULTISPECIES: nitrogen fixation protein NifZ [Zoogloea]|uniref:Nitrogen fixation protein NifZ n=1 Tax=Zoogloea dura TaxID=2728840 RepID=A0A848G443_9RHOO|nr:nitrogen fixation protein NifZ [Zoogloea dura]KAB2967826.1 MAG: nitrogen fixation protein NifZ [Zoogloea sp.]NML25989.1 nitrogen fixation protein NifZ [Zoogloea dura]
MIEPREPKYQWGQQVAAATDLFNDGSHPEVPEDELIVSAGTTGEVVQIGHHEEANIPVYIVEFGAAEGRVGRVVGCLEEELAAA